VIIHGPKAPASFTVIPNRILRDDHLSYRARGLLAYLLSQPPDWKISSRRLMVATTEGRDAIRTALRELIQVGYLDLVRTQDDAGRWGSEYRVTDTPWYFGSDPVDNSAQPVDNSVTGA
jgi:hypothetical protein